MAEKKTFECYALDMHNHSMVHKTIAAKSKWDENVLLLLHSMEDEIRDPDSVFALCVLERRPEHTSTDILRIAVEYLTEVTSQYEKKLSA